MDIQKIKELNEKRTQGQWVSTQYHDCQPDETFSWLVINEESPGAVYDLQVNSLRERDAKFIAAAPTMMQVIHKQQELLKSAREEIRGFSADIQNTYIHMGYHTHLDNTKDSYEMIKVKRDILLKRMEKLEYVDKQLSAAIND